MSGRRGFHALHELFNRRSLAQEGELVGVRHAEIYGVFRLQFVTKDFFTVDKGSVAAAHVFQHHGAVHRKNLRLLAADAAVAQGEFVAALTADSKRCCADGHFAMSTVRFCYNKPGYAWHRIVVSASRTGKQSRPGATRRYGTW